MTLQAKLRAQQGADWFQGLVYEVDGEPVDLTDGYSAHMQVRKTHASTEVIANLTSEPEGGITLGSEGTINLALYKAETALIQGRQYVYDLELTDKNGITKRILEGAFIVTPEVTREVPIV